MLNIIIVGLGNIGLKRFNLIHKSKFFNVIALVDKKFTNVLKKKFKNIDYFNNYKKINLFKKKIDLVFVATNPSSSFVISEYFLKNNINIFIEKPPCFSFAKYKKLNNLAIQKKLLLKVGYNLMFDLGFNALKKYIDKSHFGKVYCIDAEYLYGTSKSNNNKVGSLMDVGIHLIYLTNYLIGNFEPLQLYLENNEIKNNLDDNGSALFISNQKNISINMKFSLIHWENRFNYKIICEKGMLELSGLPKWGNQKLIIASRKLPSGVPYKRYRYFSVDKSFEDEIKNLKQILQNKNKFKLLNTNDFNIIKILNKSLSKSFNKQLVKYFHE